MGILNLTPDSFSDGGKFFDHQTALKHAEQMINEGAEIIDIGPQSTRPGARKLTAKEEIVRLGNVIKELKQNFPSVLISVDTFYSEVVDYAYPQGMDIINDISGGMFDDNMFETIAKTQLPYILMHVNASYETMHDKNINEDIILNINRYFSEKILELKNKGVYDIILDPGFGFGKTVEQQLQMTNELECIGFGRLPLLVGISRKSFIYKPLGKLPNEINEETQNLHLKMLQKGAKILRVHDVASAKQTIEKFLAS